MLKSIPRVPHQQLLHEAALRGVRQIKVSLLDGAAPSRLINPGTVVCHGTCFAALLPKLLAVAPLSMDTASPVLTMRPDDEDWAMCPPDEIREQFRELIKGSVPEFGDHPMKELGRRAAYNWAREADLSIMATEERHDYANLGLILDPTRGSFKDFPRALTPPLAAEMQLCGHSNKIIVTGGNSEWRRYLRSLDQLIELGRGSTVLEVVKAITAEWEPNFSRLPEDFAIRDSVACYSRGDAVEDQVAAVFQEKEDWAKIRPAAVNRNLMSHEVGMWYVAALVETAEDTDLAVVITNGVTRDPLQGRFVPDSG